MMARYIVQSMSGAGALDPPGGLSSSSSTDTKFTVRSNLGMSGKPWAKEQQAKGVGDVRSPKILFIINYIIIYDDMSHTYIYIYIII